jgi:hypothetical protein
MPASSQMCQDLKFDDGLPDGLLEGLLRHVGDAEGGLGLLRVRSRDYQRQNLRSSMDWSPLGCC